MMKSTDCKPFFCFVMGCLGGSLFLALGIQSLNEKSSFQRDLVCVLNFGMYVCFIGLVNYDVAYNKVIHFTFVLVMMVFGYAFSNSALSRRQNGLHSTASVGYNIFTSVFLICFLLNFHMQSQGFTDYHTVQTCFEIVWVLSLVFMLCVYAFGDLNDTNLY